MSADITKKVAVSYGDITNLALEAIVNASDENLSGGGGVDRAIHQAAGIQLAQECRKIGRCPTGEAVITPGFNLPAKWVIHTAGPVWRGGKKGEDALLANCYKNALALAEAHGIKTVGFPAISCGVFRFPARRAAKIAMTQAKEFLGHSKVVNGIGFVCFNEETWDVFRKAREKMFPEIHK
jgi:O-acetyl-ADP-ribose deacetylase (regulator of RNase III)